MLVRFAPVLVATLFASLTLGCEPAPRVELDGGATADGLGGAYELSLVGPSTLTLGLGERRTIEVALRDASGEAAPSERVTFSLDGTSADTSITALEGATDALGIARIDVVAGFVPASFRVRTSHPRASLLFVDVSVGAAFGTLRVEPTYAGGRAVARTIVRVYGDRTCESALADPTGGRERGLPAGSGSVEFTALPVGLAYSVLAVGESATGAIYAAGCVERVMLTADLPTTVAVELVDSALGYDGSYLVQLSLDASLAIAAAGDEAELAAALGGTEGDAARLVTALALVLEAGGATTEASALRADAAVAEAALVLALDAGPSSPGALLLARYRDAASIVGTLDIGGWLSIGLAGAPAIRFERLVVGGPDDLVTLDPVEVFGTGTEFVATLDAVGGSLVIERLGVDARLGALVMSVAEARAGIVAPETLADSLDAGVCVALDDFVASRPAVLSVCDASCRRAACHGALGATVSVLEGVATALDERGARIGLAGSLDATDADADAHADLFDGAVGGTWEPLAGTGGGAVSGALTASLAVP